MEGDSNITMSISATTRPMRPGETADVDDHFVRARKYPYVRNHLALGRQRGGILALPRRQGRHVASDEAIERFGRLGAAESHAQAIGSVDEDRAILECLIGTLQVRGHASCDTHPSRVQTIGSFRGATSERSESAVRPAMEGT